MKKLRKIVGIFMVITVVGGIFIFTAQSGGYIEALKAWALAIGITVLIVGGILLATWD